MAIYMHFKCPNHRDQSIHIVYDVLCEAFLWPVMYLPKMVILKARKLGARSKIFLFSKTAQDYGNRLADNYLVM